MYYVNMKEFSVLIFHSRFTCILNYTLNCCVLGLKEMSIKLLDNAGRFFFDNVVYILSE